MRGDRLSWSMTFGGRNSEWCVPTLDVLKVRNRLTRHGCQRTGSMLSVGGLQAQIDPYILKPM